MSLPPLPLTTYVAAMFWEEEGLWLEEEDPCCGGFRNTTTFTLDWPSAPSPQALLLAQQDALLRKAWHATPQQLKDHYLFASGRLTWLAQRVGDRYVVRYNTQARVLEQWCAAS